MTVSAAMPRFRQPAQVPFNFSELVIDSFAGGGGASTGIERALGRAVDIAINHDPGAIRMHEVNHPHTRHYCESVWDVDPRKVCDGRPVGLAWFSPDCKHFSKAKGAKPVEKAVRGLAWVVLRWAATVLPRVIMLENVEEFVTWGPLVRREDGKHYPCPKGRGRTFNSFVNALRRHGYRVEWRELRACDYGAPTIRKRLFLIARRDGEPIVWPEPTHADPKKAEGLMPWRTAAECIDWSIPCLSIFERKKPLAEATLRRIAKGIMRYVVESPEPFIVSYYGEKKGDRGRGQTLLVPLRTQTTENRFALVTPHVTKFQQNSIGFAAGEPFHTAMAGAARFGLVSAFLAKHYGGVVGTSLQVPSGTVTTVDHHSLVAAHMVRSFGESVGSHPEAPVGTITAGGMGKTGIVAANLVRNFGRSAGADAAEPSCTITGKMKDSLVSSHLVKLRGTCADGQPVTAPLHTVSAQGQHFGEVRAFLMQYHGMSESHDLKKPINTVTSKDRFGLVTVRGVEYQIVDIGMRMLTPRELFRAQGFPEDYIIDRDAAGRAITKTDQVARCGNSVCPPMSEVLVRANLASAARERAAV